MTSGLKAEEKVFKSCYQCAALRDCYPQSVLDRQQARDLAVSCTKPYKGISTDIVEVIGRDTGMSRGKALKMVRKGRGRWVGKDRIAID